MDGILRGEIYRADLDPTVGHEQAGRCSVLIVSRQAFNDCSGTVIAIALTSVEPKAGYPFTMELTRTGLPKRSWVKISQIRALSTQRLAGRIASCHPPELNRVIEGLNELIGKP